MKRLKASLFVLSLMFVASKGFSENSPHAWYVTPKVGLSSFTGLLGFEFQREHLALDFGLPLSGGVRYYVRPHQHSWFAGLYGMGWGYDNDETKDGIAYTHYSMVSGGAGGGYRWFWRSRWSLELGMSFGYLERRWSNTFVKRTEKGLLLFPVASLGFSFW